MKFKRTTSILIAIILGLNFSINTVKTFAHEALLDVEYDNCECDEDIEAYFAGTLEFYYPDDNLETE